MTSRFVTRNHGFTLIELSIVLVIIGLVAGGVLIGRDMIHAARIRKVVSQIDEMNSATLTFRTKYNCLPGDCANAADFGLVHSGNTDTKALVGNGDGIIGSRANYHAATNYWEPYERAYYYQQLYIAELLQGNKACKAGDWSGNPASADKYGQNCYHGSKLDYVRTIGGTVTGGIAVFMPRLYPQGHYYQLLATSADGAAWKAECGWGAVNSHWCNTLRPQDAYGIDAKMDDGLPLTGTVVAFDAASYLYSTGANTTPFNNPTAGAAGSSNCTDNGVTPNVYNITSNDPYRCSLNIKTAW